MIGRPGEERARCSNGRDGDDRDRDEMGPQPQHAFVIGACWQQQATQARESRLRAPVCGSTPRRRSADSHPRGIYDLSVGRVGWWLLTATTLAFIVLVAAAAWAPDKWTGIVILELFGLYLGAMLIVGTAAFVITALVRSKRAADRAQRAAPDV